MKNKKGIVLFVTLLFIVALSVLIVKNLAITDEFIGISSKNANIKQLEISIENINKEVVSMFKTKGIKSLPEDIEFPFSYGNVEVAIHLEEYDNINRYKLDENVTTFPPDIDRSSLLEIIKGKRIENQRQVDYVIDEYINKTNDYRILEVAEQFTYYPILPPNKNISCRYDVDIDGLKANVFFVFSLTDYQIKVKPTIIIKR
jgi:hypothetical protein